MSRTPPQTWSAAVRAIGIEGRKGMGGIVKEMERERVEEEFKRYIEIDKELQKKQFDI